MRKITLLLSLLMTLFTTAMAQDPSIMEIKEGKAYTIKFTNNTPSLVYYQADGNDNLYYETSHNSVNINNINYHFVFTNAGTDATGRQLYYISPKNAPDYFAYNKNNENGGGSASSVGLTNDDSQKAEKGKWYVFDNGTAQFIVPAWKENDGTYTRGGCCWNKWSTAGNSLGMWGRGTDGPNFAGDNSLAITLVEENNDITTETPVNDINEFVSGKIYTFESKRGWLVAGTDYVYNSVKMGTDANASTNNVNCQWILYKNDNGTYLYNIGVGKFISANADNRNVIPLSTTPTTSSVEFKKSTVDEYPIIIGVDNCAINQNSTKLEYPYGAILWSNGWTDARWYGDEGSCHKAICIGDADNATITTIKNSFNSYYKIATGKYYRFKAYNNNNAYMVANGISARMTVNTDPDYAASTFYLNEENQPVNYKYGVGIAETYNTGGIATTKETLTFTANDNGYILKTNTRTVYGNDNGEYLYHHEVGSAQQANVNRNSEAAGERTTWIIEEATSLPVTITAAGYATLYAPVALNVPSGVEAYTVTINGKWATLNKIESGIIPANTGVVLTGNQGSYSFEITDNNQVLKNDLRGSAAATYYTEAGTYYALAIVDGEIGFYKDAFNNSRFQNNSHKAYLYIPTGNNVSFFGFRFGDEEEETTGIEEVEIRNEKEEIFDLAGRRVSEITSSGIYIVNGKKVLVK